MNQEITIAISTTQRENVLEVLGLRITNGVKTVVGETTIELTPEDFEKVRVAIDLLNDIATPKPVEEGNDIVATEEVKEVKTQVRNINGKEYNLAFIEKETGVDVEIKEVAKTFTYATIEEAEEKIGEELEKLA